MEWVPFGTDDGTYVITEAPIQRDGVTFVCEIPDALGRVLKLEQRSGKVVAHTESGIQFIVPTK